MTQLPGIAGEIEEIIGLEKAVALLKARGGTEVSVPKTAKGSMLASLIGEEACDQMIRDLGSGKLQLPLSHMRGRNAERDERKAQAMALLSSGSSLREVALQCDLHMRTVGKYRAELQSKEIDKQQGQFDL